MTGGLLDEYRKEVERIFGGDLVSLTLYGSHAGDSPEPGAEVSVLIVVREVRKEALEGYHDISHKFARRGIPAPPIFTETFLRESTDVFPLEYLGIAEMRKVLAGSDVFGGLEIRDGNLRHQVEFELKGKLLSLRRMYMTAFGSRDLAGLMLKTVGPVVSAARGLLLLDDRRAPQGRVAIVDGIEKRFDVRFPALREILAAQGAGKMRPGRAGEIFFGYLEEVERLCSLSDRFHVTEGR